MQVPCRNAMRDLVPRRRRARARIVSRMGQDWRVALTTFGIVFLAELEGKTQFAALAPTGRSAAPFSAFLGAAVALVLATAAGVGAGALLSKVVPERWVEIGSAVLFIEVGVFLLPKTPVFEAAEG